MEYTIGTNKRKFKIGNLLIKLGNKLINSAKKKELLITNPSVNFVNPFTLIVSFTINNVDKYQVVFQGDYTEKYKNNETITEDEMFQLISHSKKKWFLKKKK